MILKNYETNKIDLQKYKYFLLYGNNKGHIKEIIEKNFINKFSKNIYNYDEKEILKDKTIFFEKILNNSFFEKEKLILLSNITDKSKSLIEEIKEGKNDDLIFILISDQLDKKSKIRKFFEENEDSICMAFYPDTTVTLNKIAIGFLKEYGLEKDCLDFSDAGENGVRGNGNVSGGVGSTREGDAKGAG